MAHPLSFPIGPFDRDRAITPALRASAIQDIAALPSQMRSAVAHLSAAQLDTPYRPGGWTVRQLVHHVADSHMNGLTRTKLALTEENPHIKGYDQDAWANLPDARLSVDVSLAMLEAVHTRWTAVFQSLAHEQWARTFVHPLMGTFTIDLQAQLYGWHSRHHVAHVTALREREGW